MVDQLEGYQVSLRSLAIEDIEMLRIWRNSPEISQYMVSQEQISPEQQLEWFAYQKEQTDQKHFSVFYKDQLIGSANIKVAQHQGKGDFASADMLETGLYIGAEKYRANLLAFAPSLVLNDYCFEQLGTTALFARVHPDNSNAIQYNLKLGYQIEKKGSWVEMKLLPEAYHSSSNILKGLLNRPKQRFANR